MLKDKIEKLFEMSMRVKPKVSRKVILMSTLGLEPEEVESLGSATYDTGGETYRVLTQNEFIRYKNTVVKELYDSEQDFLNDVEIIKKKIGGEIWYIVSAE